MINPNFIVATVAVLAAALLIRPQNQKLRFCLRLSFVMLGIFTWAYSTAFFISWWGYSGDFPVGFGLYCLPLCVALFPERILRNTCLFTAMFVGLILARCLGVAYPVISLSMLQKDIPSYLFMMASVLIMALPGLYCVWLCNGGMQRIERWEKARAQRRK